MSDITPARLAKAVGVCVPSIIRGYMQAQPDDCPDIIQKVLDRVDAAMASYYGTATSYGDAT